MSGTLSRNEIVHLVLRVSLASVVTYYSIKWMMNQLDPTNKSKKKARTKAELQIKRLGLNEGLKLNTNSLSEYELVIASHLVIPEDITVSWNNIAGLDAVVKELRDSVVLPIRHRNLFANSQLWQAPKGILLHGPPGCGKTLIAKATAKEAGMRFINLDVAMLTDKWYGESQKLASAVFTLAQKLQPCIVFIDEIESFLRSRNSHDHEATAMMKTQFMMLWDGLSTENGSTVIVMGATNRPQDLDKAILRRMPAQFHIGLPSEEQRKKILSLVLSSEELADDVDLNRLSKLTNGFSGSDLRELCRNSLVYRICEYMKRTDLAPSTSSTEQVPQNAASSSSTTTTSVSSNNKTDNVEDLENPPPICMSDLLGSFGKMKESKMHTGMLHVDTRIELD